MAIAFEASAAPFSPEALRPTTHASTDFCPQITVNYEVADALVIHGALNLLSTDVAAPNLVATMQAADLRLDLAMLRAQTVPEELTYAAAYKQQVERQVGSHCIMSDFESAEEPELATGRVAAVAENAVDDEAPHAITQALARAEQAGHEAQALAMASQRAIAEWRFAQETHVEFTTPELAVVRQALELQAIAAAKNRDFASSAAVHLALSHIFPPKNEPLPQAQPLPRSSTEITPNRTDKFALKCAKVASRVSSICLARLVGVALTVSSK